jgi:hypothetical protein
MEAMYVEAKRTPISFELATDMMKWKLKSILGSDPSIEVLALALAKTALETGRWTQIWNGNWGNVKCANTYKGMYCCIKLNEVLNGKIVWFAPEGQLTSKNGVVTGTVCELPPGHPQTRMRAFANNWDGVDCYVDFVAGGRYKTAWAKLLQGDAVGYVHSLKMAGYFTAPEESYRNGVVSLQKEFISRLNKVAPEKADIEWTRLQELVPRLQFDVDQLLNGDFQEDAA